MIFSDIKFFLRYVFQFLYMSSLGLCLLEELAFAKAISGDSPTRLDLGINLDPTKTATGFTFLESGKQNNTPTAVVDNKLNHPYKPRNISVHLGLSLPNSDNTLMDNSSMNLPVLESGSSPKLDKITIPEIFQSYLNKPALSHPEENVATRTLNVPSEGGVLQDQKFTGMEGSSLPLRSEVLHTRPSTKTPTDLKNANTNPQTRPATREGVSSHVSVTLGPDNGKEGLTDSTTNSNDRLELGKPTYSSDNFNQMTGGISKMSLQMSSSEVPIEHMSKISPRKGAEPPKIFPRKGVLEPVGDSTSSEQTSSKIYNDSQSATSSSKNTSAELEDMSNVFHFNRSGIKENDGINVVENVTKSITSPHNTSVNSKGEVTTKRMPVQEGHITNNSSVQKPKVLVTDLSNTSVSNVADESGIIASYPPLKKRLKPQKTTDTDALESLPISTEHSANEHDYVVPIVVTILAVPMLVVLVMFMYKKGSECWERRHYRRMDFLIDGMYND